MLVLLQNAIPGAPPKNSSVEGANCRLVLELGVGLCCWLLLSFIPVNRLGVRFYDAGDTMPLCKHTVLAAQLLKYASLLTFGAW